jgi:hypothetical protein
MPPTPPTPVMARASARNWKRMWRARAESFSTPISRVRCCTATSMMFMRPMPAMPRVSAPTRERRTWRAMERIWNWWSWERDWRRERRRGRWGGSGARGEGLADGFLDLLIVAVIADPDTVEVGGVFEVAHGVEGNVDGAIDVVVGFLHFGLEDADDGEDDAVEADGFADRPAPEKSLVLASEPRTQT